MMQVPSNDASKDQIRQNALDFVQINVEIHPLEGRDNVLERNNVFINDKLNALEQIAVAQCFAPFQEQICSLSVLQSIVSYTKGQTRRAPTE